MVGNSATVTLASFANRRATVSTETMEPQGGRELRRSRDEAKDDRKSEAKALGKVLSTWSRRGMASQLGPRFVVRASLHANQEITNC